MSVPFAEMRRVLAYAAEHLDGDVSLSALARQAGLSRFQLHRMFSSAIGETPKQLTFRLRLGRAAMLLLTTDDSVLDVALACGFESHEVFSRAFRRCFGLTPQAYRKRGIAGEVDRKRAKRLAAEAARTAPCIGLYHKTDQKRGPTMSEYSIAKRELARQPVLLVRSRIKREEIAATIGRSLHLVGAYAGKNGIAMSGPPFARYAENSLGMLTIEPGMPVTVDVSVAQEDAQAGIIATFLPAGPAAVTTHKGPYDKLIECHAAMEQWIAAQGLTPAGPPWESYVTDPADVPDPSDWATEVFYPLEK